MHLGFGGNKKMPKITIFIMMTVPSRRKENTKMNVQGNWANPKKYLLKIREKENCRCFGWMSDLSKMPEIIQLPMSILFWFLRPR